MIDLDLLRNNLEEVKSNLSKRAFDFDTSLWNELEENRKDLQVQMESYQAKQNTIAKEIGSAQKNKDSIEDLKSKASEISNKLKKVKEKFQTNKIEYDDFLLSIPNLVDASVPQGKSEEDNEILEEIGEIPSFN